MAAMDGFFKIPRGGIEIGGVLFGVIEENRVLIQAFRMLECEHASGPSFVLSDADRTRLAGLLVAAAEARERAGLAPIGWFRSRTRSEISLSEVDFALFDTYFPESRQVVLVLRREVTRPARGGFFFREEEGALRVESSYKEFELEAVPVEEPDAQALPAIAAPYPGLKFLAVAPPPRSYLRPLWIFALCVSLAAAGVAARECLDAKTPPIEQFSLEALDRSSQLQFVWDRSARPILHALGGNLEITDGQSRLSTELVGGQLQHGSFSYSRRTERVDAHMTVGRRGRQIDGVIRHFLLGPRMNAECAGINRHGIENERVLQRKM